MDMGGATETDEGLAAIRAFPVVIVQRLLSGFLPFSSSVELVWFHVKLGCMELHACVAAYNE